MTHRNAPRKCLRAVLPTRLCLSVLRQRRERVAIMWICAAFPSSAIGALDEVQRQSEAPTERLERAR